MKLRYVVAIAMGFALALWPSFAQADSWPTYAEIGPALLDLQNTYPTLCERHDLGLSVQGRHIWAIRISDNIGSEEDEPEFKFVSTIHGNEPHGTKMLILLAEHLLSNYGSDMRLTNMVNEMDIWLVPLMNPDGYDRTSPTRYNANGEDLNRNFPDYGDDNTTTGREIEVAHIMNWTAAESFILSGGFHTGACVVNYPFDNTDTGSQYTPDDDLIVAISTEYAEDNPRILAGGWPGGIVNGVDWYSTHGNMQDWNYHFHGCNEVTIEISDDQSPPMPSISEITTYWNENRESMVSYMETTLIGIRGIVTDGNTGLPLAATMVVIGRNHEIYTDPDVGDYHRMLLPGTYDIQFTADGYEPIVMTNVPVLEGDATRVDVQMWPAPAISAPNGGETLTAGMPTYVTWTGNPTAQFQVQYTGNYGDTDTAVDGFERTTLGEDYETGGDDVWFTTTSSSHSGSRSARAGAITHSQSTWMTRTVSDGPLSFYYRVSSESSWDWFNFYVDGERKIHVSGTVSWTQYAETLTGGGSHVLKWEYTKDINTSSGSDTVWIDDVSVTADNTVWTDIIDLTGIGATSVSWTPANEPGDAYKVRVRSFNGTNYSNWDESDGTFTVEESQECIPGNVEITVFVDMLLNPAAYTTEQLCPADVNEDDVVDGEDIQPYVALLIGN